MTRLNHALLARWAGRSDLRLPAFDPADLRVGIVHLGIGAFHRAHQAMFTEDCLTADDLTWGISGYTQRSTSVCDQLGPQDGLYTVLERGVGAALPRVAGVVRQIGSAQIAPGPVVQMADPDVRVVTLTVTEKGYRVGADGHLFLADPLVQADLAGLSGVAHTAGAAGDYVPITVVGQLVAGLALRRRSDRGLTVLSCDNLAGNGAVVRRLVFDFCAAIPGGEALAAWIEGAVSFPSSMIDRIVPATSAADRDDVQRLLGVIDEGVVVTEPFKQWVIEDAFAVGRPRWENAGAVFTSDVAPYEAAKLRLLNASHSLLAYSGALAGYRTIAEAVADPVLAEAAQSLMVVDAAPTLTVPHGFDLAGYQAEVLQRFANPALGHRTVQVAADGSLKLPIRLLATARDRLAAGAEPRWVALAVACWMIFVTRQATFDGEPLVVDDPLLGRLSAAARSSAGAGAGSGAGLVDALLGVREVFAEDLAANRVFRSLLIDHVERLLASRKVGENAW